MHLMNSAFAQWLDAWLVAHEGEWNHEKVSAVVGVSKAAISQWRNGVSTPEAQHILKLSEVTGEDHHYLAHLAYGWPLDAPTDPMLKEPLIREAGMLLKQLVIKAPDLVPAVTEVVRGLLRLARKRENTDEPGGGK
jgi:transcriptional regulator with XRE-family HTH domain